MRTGLPATVILALLASGPAGAQELKPVAGDSLPPPLELEALDGRVHTLSDYRDQVVLVNFWTTWCPPCVKEIPALQRLERRMAGRPFKTLAVNVAEARDIGAAMVRRLGADFTVLLDPGGDTVRPWKVYVFPTSFLVDPRGRIRYAVGGALEWDRGEALETIEQLMPDRR